MAGKFTKITGFILLFGITIITWLLKPWAWGDPIIGSLLYALVAISIGTIFLFIATLLDNANNTNAFINMKKHHIPLPPIVITFQINLLTDLYIPVQKMADTPSLVITAPIVSRVLACFAMYMNQQSPERCQAILSALLSRAKEQGEEHAHPDNKH